MGRTRFSCRADKRLLIRVHEIRQRHRSTPLSTVWLRGIDVDNDGFEAKPEATDLQHELPLSADIRSLDKANLTG